MSGVGSKAELRVAMRRLRRGIADAEERSAVIRERVTRLGVVRAARRVMVFTAIRGEPDMAPFARWCVVEGKQTVLPEEGPDPGWPDVVIVPGIAFTREGARLGQGGGWYDRFLVARRRDCVAIGVGFHEQLLDALPTEEHDVLLDLVVTDAP